MSVDLLRQKLVAVADSIRERVDITEQMTLDEMPPYIDGIASDASHIEVATIIGDGNSWIDSKINPNPQYTVETRFRVVGFEDERLDPPFGTRRLDTSVSTGATGAFGMRYDGGEDGLLQVFYSDTYTSARQVFKSTDISKQNSRHYKTYKLSKGVFSVDDTVIHTFTTSTNTEHYPYTLYLMAYNASDWIGAENHATPGDPGSGNTGLLEVCYYKIWDQNDKLILDLVPALKSDGTVCMYDRVNGGYYYNKGSGTFGYALTTGTEVTYYITTDISYVEEREEGEDCIPPNTFTPALDGYEFVGWNEDDGSDYTPETDTFAGIPEKYEASTISSKIMGVDPISLYAVFSAAAKGINVYTSTLDSKTGAYIPNSTPTFYPYAYYYNNGNTIVDCFGPWEVEDPDLALSDAEKGCLITFYDADNVVAWSGGVSNKPTGGLRVGLVPDPTKLKTYYAVYERLLSIVYRSAIGVTTNQIEIGNIMNYWNSNGQTKLNSFTISRNNYFTKDGYTFQGWANTYDSNIYQPNELFTPNCSGDCAVTLYPTWKRDPVTSIQGSTYVADALPNLVEYANAGYSNYKGSSGEFYTDMHPAIIGGYGYINGANQIVGVDTGNIDTLDYSTLTLDMYVDHTPGAGGLMAPPTMVIYGDGSVISSYDANTGNGIFWTYAQSSDGYHYLDPPTSQYVLDVSEYDTVRLVYTVQTGDNSAYGGACCMGFTSLNLS